MNRGLQGFPQPTPPGTGLNIQNVEIRSANFAVHSTDHAGWLFQLTASLTASLPSFKSVRKGYTVGFLQTSSDAAAQPAVTAVSGEFINGSQPSLTVNTSYTGFWLTAGANGWYVTATIGGGGGGLDGFVAQILDLF